MDDEKFPFSAWPTLPNPFSLIYKQAKYERAYSFQYLRTANISRAVNSVQI